MIHDSLNFSDEVQVALGRGRVFEDGLGMVGNVVVECFNPDGSLKDFREVQNLIVTTGKNMVADRLSAAPTNAAISHMAIGTGSVAAALGDTTLGAETDRNAVTSSLDAANVLTVIGDWAAGDGTNAALREAGIFNAGAAGNMFARVVYSNIDKGALDTLKITWTLTFG